jgi:hypothetical protein
MSMMKDGRPSLITDIRLFHGGDGTYLKGHEEAVAFGRRLAWFLNGEGVSLGAYHSLYILFTSSLDAGEIRVTDFGLDWWQRYTNVGVPSDFPNVPNASELAMGGIGGALRAIRPGLTTLIDHAEQTVRTNGDDLRFLLKSARTRQFMVDISSNIPVWPQPSLLFVSLTDRSNGACLEASPFPMQFYTDGLDLVGKIKVSSTDLTLLPKPSFVGKLASARYGRPLVKPISEFVPTTQPAMSKLVRMRR